LPLVGIGRKNAVGRLWTFKEDFSKDFRALWRVGRFGVVPLLPKDQPINGTVKYFEKLKVER
jgi:hypothetical protein